MKIKWYTAEEDHKVYASRYTASNWDSSPAGAVLHFGKWSKEVKIAIDESLDDDTIGLPSNLSDLFTFPDSLPYEMYLDGKNLYIGPVIGLMVSPGRKRNYYKKFFNNYEEIKGLIYLFTRKGINKINQTITGYYFQPCPNGRADWKKGTFPYPGAVFRIPFSKRALPQDFIQDIGGIKKIFNYKYFNKWDLWNLLSTFPHILRHLPHTEKLKDAESLEKMVETHGVIYLKDVSSYMAKGLYKVEKVDKNYRFIDTFKDEVILNGRFQLAGFIHHFIKKKSYILQQGVPLIFEGRQVDFRVILQKNRSKNWTCSAIVARFGSPGSASSNFIRNGYLLSGKDALSQIFKMSDKEADQKLAEIISICKESCEIIDMIGNYGDVGIDIVVDKNLHVWLLEINKNPDHSILKHLKNNQKLYQKVLSTPLEYAKSLAGF